MANTTEQYRVWCTDIGETEEDCRLVMAFDHEEAARDFAEADYNEEPTVHVRCTFGGDEGELRVFEVTPEPMVHFSAMDVTP